jgi:hypothetical protein
VDQAFELGGARLGSSSSKSRVRSGLNWANRLGLTCVCRIVSSTEACCEHSRRPAFRCRPSST